MGYLVGTDEAGYGPNLGPLVISATVWEAPDGIDAEGLFAHLDQVIAPRLDSVAAARGPRVAMADSKKLYTAGNGLANLERGLWAALGVLDSRPSTWRELWQSLAPDALKMMPGIAWYAHYDEPAPIDCDRDQIEPIIAALRSGFTSAGVRLLAVRSRVVFEEQFNDLVEQYGSKGESLSHQTLALAAELIEQLPPGPVSVVCDKHGGRDRYGRLLAGHFPEWLIEVRAEGSARSVYRFGPPERRVEACFRTQAENCLPAALASMASKYLRELAMRALNEYWRGLVPGLRPTAGYPQDAKRFRADIAKTQTRLCIKDRAFWRAR
jgi:hypothetical protein